MMIDPNTEFGQKVIFRLNEEEVIWLTTVAGDGTPQPNPVWFLWDGESILIYTRPQSKKIANIRNGSRVSLNFDATESGEDVVIFNGTAQFAPDTAPVHENPAYVDKYRRSLALLGSSPEKMGAEYTVAIRIQPDRLRGW